MHSHTLSPPPSPSAEENALAAIEIVGPRNYRVTGLPSGQPLYFFVLGCQGEEGERQRSVARLMNEQAAKKQPAFLLFLGDNIYGGAVESLQDPRFSVRFHDVYCLPRLRDVPGILILGNHDANLENFTYHPNRFFSLPGINLVMSAYKTGKAVEKYEVGHTYLHAAPELYQQDTLPIDTLPKWGMPYYFCSYHFVEANTQLFCLNSNSFVFDCIQHWSATSAGSSSTAATPNQAAWFTQAFQAAKAAGLATLVAMHNPSLTSSKRALPNKYDAHLYLSAKQIQQMNYLLKHIAADSCSPELINNIFNETDANINAAVASEETNGNYAAMQHACFQLLNIRPAAQMHAHDHALVYNRTPGMCQIISGAGGSTNLMSKATKKNDDTIGCFLNEPGFVAVTCDAAGAHPAIISEFHTTKGHYRLFTNDSHEPVISRDPASTVAAAETETLIPRSLRFS